MYIGKVMKIGVYLGSFDPMHLGHLRVIAEMFAVRGLDRVVVVPTMQNPIKPHAPKDIELRRDIIWHELAYMCDCIDINRVSVDLLERELTAPYYTYKTLQRVQDKYSWGELYVIMGADCRAAMQYWSHGDQILRDYHLIVVDRTMESSTEIRRRIAAGISLDGLVPVGSESYIIKRYTQM